MLIVGADKDKDTSTPVEGMVGPLIEAYEAAPDVETTGVVLSGDHAFSWSRAALIRTVRDWAEACR